MMHMMIEVLFSLASWATLEALVGMAWNLVHGDDAFLYLIRLSPLVLMFCDDDDGLWVGLLLVRDGLFRSQGSKADHGSAIKPEIITSDNQTMILV